MFLIQKGKSVIKSKEDTADRTDFLTRLEKIFDTERILGQFEVEFSLVDLCKDLFHFGLWTVRNVEHFGRKGQVDEVGRVWR